MKIQKYTHNPILGCLPRKMLPDGFALVLEGGGHARILHFWRI